MHKHQNKTVLQTTKTNKTDACTINIQKHLNQNINTNQSIDTHYWKYNRCKHKQCYEILLCYQTMLTIRQILGNNKMVKKYSSFKSINSYKRLSHSFGLNEGQVDLVISYFSIYNGFKDQRQHTKLQMYKCYTCFLGNKINKQNRGQGRIGKISVNTTHILYFFLRK